LPLSHCFGSTILSLWSAKSHDFTKFPVKFPVSRENGQSRGPSALRRQPTRVQTQLIDPISGRGLLPAVFDGENIGAIVARLAGSVHGDPDQVSAIPALLH